MKKILFILLVATACNVTPDITANLNKYVKVVEPSQVPGKKANVRYVAKDTLVFGSLPFVLNKITVNEFEMKTYECIASHDELSVLIDAVFDKYHNLVEPEILGKVFTLCGSEAISNCHYFERGDEVLLFGFEIYVLPKATFERAKTLIDQEEAEKQARYDRIYNSL